MFIGGFFFFSRFFLFVFVPPPVNTKAAGKTAKEVAAACEAKGANVRVIDDDTVGLNFGESITHEDVVALVSASAINSSSSSGGSRSSSR